MMKADRLPIDVNPYLTKYPGEFTKTASGHLYCLLCARLLMCYRQISIIQHLRSAKHLIRRQRRPGWLKTLMKSEKMEFHGTSHASEPTSESTHFDGSVSSDEHNSNGNCTIGSPFSSHPNVHNWCELWWLVFF
uniref:C2H2-type domain-containing protein n=1 Tax=Mesocestoides corti TaxID=53468 RepID=A0A5K3FF13_MESCO